MSEPAELSPAPARLVVATAAGYTNVGDDAIAQAVLARLSRELPTTRLIVVAGREYVPTPTRKETAYRAWDDCQRLGALVEAADAVILCGGGLLYDSTFQVRGADIFGRGSQWLLRAARLAALARIAGRPLMLWGVGVGPLVSEGGRALTRFVAESAQCITVRDEYSRQALVECGVAAPIHVTGDSALTLEAQRGERAVAAGLSHLPRPWIALNLRPWFRLRHVALASRPAMERLAAVVKTGVERLSEHTGGSIVGLALQREKDDDARLLRRVLSDLARRGRATVVRPRTPGEAQAMLSRVDGAIAMRLHAVVFAANCGVPSVALAYDPKVACFMAELGLEQYTLAVEEVTAAALVDATMRAMRQRQELEQQIRSRRMDLVRRCEALPRLLREMLDRPGATPPATREAPVAWPAERALLLRRIAALERERRSWLMRAAEPLRWAAEVMRRLTGRG